MKLSREARRQSRELFQLAMVDGSLDADRLRQVADGVAEAKPSEYLQILKELTRLARLEVARHHATVESAVSLSQSDAKSIEESLRSRFGALTTEFRTNPALLGGLRLRVGSDVWDNSVKARLQDLQNQL